MTSIRTDSNFQSLIGGVQSLGTGIEDEYRYCIHLPGHNMAEGNISMELKPKIGYSLVSILVLTIITQFAADGYIGIDDFFAFILIIYTISIIPIVIVYHFVKIYLRNTNDSEKIQTRAEIEFASKNYTKALSLYKKLGDLEKISSCVEQIEKTKVTVKRVEINENDSSQPANLQVQDSVVTGEINYIVNEPSDEVALQSQIEADDESKEFNPLPFILLGLLVSAIITAAFKSWLIG
jgi:hypothetical protein